MKKYWRKGVFTAAFAMMLLLFTACGTNGYVCEMPAENTPVSITEKTELVKTIGNMEFKLRLVKSYISSQTGRTVDVYEVIDTDSLANDGIVKLDRETGDVLSFANLSPTPYVLAEDILDLQGEEFQTAVEEALGFAYDFSAYNEFVRTKVTIDGTNTLTWSVKEQNISLTVYITANGGIEGVSRIDAGTDASDVLALSEAQRDELILKCLKKEGEIASVKNMTVEIVSAKQSTYQEHDAVIYTARVRDAEGFVSLHVLVIYKD